MKCFGIRGWVQAVLTSIAYHLARCAIRPFKNFCIKFFARHYNIAAFNLNQYPNFNSFFTRKAGYPIEVTSTDRGLVSPVEGQLTGLNNVQQDGCVIVKQHKFTIASLLGSDTASVFNGGSAMVFYLAPYNYHRVHMPLNGTIKKVQYVPGKLFSVKPKCAAKMPDLLARNERVVVYIETETLGLVALVLVGAALVSGIELVWQGVIKENKLTTLDLLAPLSLKQGQELGRFNFGSSVVLLLPATATIAFSGLRLLDTKTPYAVRAGEQLLS